ncbi:MAG: class I SAM-dependent methyltransferase [Nitrospirae bacterium]|nr:class I SAM-dependent methyltransferase [Nitrospirota bacterium]
MFEKEVEDGKRFEFGKNWKSFLSVLDDERISQAENSLRQMLEINDLKGKSFLDIGSGSGLFSLAARRLGARVHSLDYDPQSVACTSELKKRYFPDDDKWIVERGSVLDRRYMEDLGKFDIVYSWGVLHHTGHMWKALENACIPVKIDGLLYIAIYNDQGIKSRIWLKIKQFYCYGSFAKYITVAVFFPFFFLKRLLVDLLSFRNPIRRYAEYKKNRGMSVIRDWIDWLGGLPYEFAKPEDVIYFYEDKHYSLIKLKIDKLVSKDMNEFIFMRGASGQIE